MAVIRYGITAYHTCIPLLEPQPHQIKAFYYESRGEKEHNNYSSSWIELKKSLKDLKHHPLILLNQLSLIRLVVYHITLAKN